MHRLVEIVERVRSVLQMEWALGSLRAWIAWIAFYGRFAWTAWTAWIAFYGRFAWTAFYGRFAWILR
jgi:hypothetical protein